MISIFVLHSLLSIFEFLSDDQHFSVIISDVTHAAQRSWPDAGKILSPAQSLQKAGGFVLTRRLACGREYMGYF